MAQFVPFIFICVNHFITDLCKGWMSDCYEPICLLDKEEMPSSQCNYGFFISAAVG